MYVLSKEIRIFYKCLKLFQRIIFRKLPLPNRSLLKFYLNFLLIKTFSIQLIYIEVTLTHRLTICVHYLVLYSETDYYVLMHSVSSSILYFLVFLYLAFPSTSSRAMLYYCFVEGFVIEKRIYRYFLSGFQRKRSWQYCVAVKHWNRSLEAWF